jgi:glutaryl-CoA dehydrogenase
MNRSLLRTATRSVQAAPPFVAGRRYASSAVFNWEDPLAAAELYTEEELAIQDTARQYCQDKLMPRVLGMCSIPIPSQHGGLTSVVF